MRAIELRLWLLRSFVFVSALTAAFPSAQAQIVPDSTLPENSRVVTDCSQCVIEGGTVRGDHLFHSFREFSIPTAGTAIQ
ncbi:hypothetical protein ACN4EK_18630 [Pantanalinema rosaneae CENA516]|uniref:hypothetical protein n=1 Tax=Pantanalinema rosaneae TaxID=1620701 RepID=UPI003D6EA91A